MESVLKDYIEQQMRAQGDDIELDVDDDLGLIGLDSIAYVRLVSFIEGEFGLRVPESAVTVEHFGTVARIATYLQERLDGDDG